NEIGSNRFFEDTLAIYLWGNRIEPSDWGYPKHRDTRSRDYRITSNVFAGNRVGIRVSNTSSAHVNGNRFVGVDSEIVRGDSAGVVRGQADTSLERVSRGAALWPPRRPALAAELRRAPMPIAGAFDARRTDTL